MAIQTGTHTFVGTMGNITGYKVRGKHYSKTKSTVPANKLKNDPAYQRTRENCSEFGTASSAGALIRRAFKPLLAHVNTDTLAGTMTKHCLRLAKQDSDSGRGQRKILPGVLGGLTGFEFDLHNYLGSSLQVPYTTHIDRNNGKWTVDFPAFTPSEGIQAPAGATHFSIITGFAAIDFDSNRQVSDVHTTGALPLNDTLLKGLQLQIELVPASQHPLFAALGIQFYKNERGITVPMPKSSSNALKLVEVSCFETIASQPDIPAAKIPASTMPQEVIKKKETPARYQEEPRHLLSEAHLSVPISQTSGQLVHRVKTDSPTHSSSPLQHTKPARHQSFPQAWLDTVYGSHHALPPGYYWHRHLYPHFNPPKATALKHLRQLFLARQST